MSSTGTILLALHDPAYAATLADALRADGHTVVAANAGAEVPARDEDLRPDLVVLDVDLPGCDGIEICRQLVAASGDACAPVLFHASDAGSPRIAAAFAAGATDYFVTAATMDEIRARVRAHLQTHVLLKEQKAMAEQLSRANAAKNRFIGMAAHDMRNPLVSIRGFAEFLMDGTVGPMPQVQLALVSIIHGTSNLMIKTLNELLDVATIEAGQLKLQPSLHSLVELVNKSIAQAKIEARKRRSRIEFAPPVTAPVLVMDADKMKQVVDNLLSNAIKFSPPASVITVAVETAADGGQCAFAVRDQGPGIAAEERDRLFRPFAGRSEADAPEDKSAGVALVICRNIVEAHQGRITAENLPDKGCEFRVTLPLPPVPQ